MEVEGTEGKTGTVFKKREEGRGMLLLLLRDGADETGESRGQVLVDFTEVHLLLR